MNEPSSTDRLVRARRLIVLVALILVCGLCVAAALGAVVRSANSVSQRERLLDGSLPRGTDSVLLLLGEHAEAVERFGALIEPDERFVVVGDRARNPLYRQLTRYYFFPALAAATTRDADVVIGFEQDRTPVGFEQIASVGAAWLARRAR